MDEELDLKWFKCVGFHYEVLGLSHYIKKRKNSSKEYEELCHAWLVKQRPRTMESKLFTIGAVLTIEELYGEYNE